MPKIMFMPNNVAVNVPEGTVVLDAALDNNIRINHNCGGNCACSTCHVIIEAGFESLEEITEDETDMLDEVENLSATSRLACQAKAKSDLVVRIPEAIDEFDDNL